MGQREDTTPPEPEAPGSSRGDGAIAQPHSHELMLVLKVWRKGVLEEHTVELVHDCGLRDTATQEELPW